MPKPHYPTYKEMLDMQNAADAKRAKPMLPRDEARHADEVFNTVAKKRRQEVMGEVPPTKNKKAAKPVLRYAVVCQAAVTVEAGVHEVLYVQVTEDLDTIVHTTAPGFVTTTVETIPLDSEAALEGVLARLSVPVVTHLG